MSDPAQTLADDTAMRALALLTALRNSVLASIAAAGPAYATRYQSLLADIDRAITVFRADAGLLTQSALRLAAEAGDAGAIDAARAAKLEIPAAYIGISDTLVRTASQYTFTLLDDVSTRARARITSSLQLAALGGMSYDALVTQLGSNRNGMPEVFAKDAQSLEAVVRTEIMRIRNMAYADQTSQLAERYTGMRKQWLHSTQAPGATRWQRRTARINHVAAALTTADAPIPVDEPFNLGGGITARYPHDPLLPPGETVNCRCRMLLVPPPP